MGKNKLDKIKAVFFDFGNTLADNSILNLSGSLKAVEEILKIYKLPYDSSKYIPLAKEAMKRAQKAQRKLFYNLPLEKQDDQKFGEFFVTTCCRELLTLIGKKQEKRIVEQTYNAFLKGYAMANSLFPGTEEVLGLLKKRYKLGIISNNPIECVRDPLECLGIASLFDTIVISGEEGIGITKPNPEIFQRALDRLGVKPEESVMVGDTFETDAEGAKNIGMVSIWIDMEGKKQCFSVQPDFIVHDIREIEEIFKDIIL